MAVRLMSRRAWTLLTVVLLTVLALVGLTVIPARADARRMPAEILQAENS